jgi:hypothetical protein
MASRFPKVDILTRRSMKGGGDRGAKKTTFLQITARTKVRCGEDLEVSKRKIHESDQSRATQAIRQELIDRAKAHESSCNKCRSLK